MSTRRVTEHGGLTKDRERLMIVTCYEEGINKEDIKKLNPYCKTHQVLVKSGSSYEYLQKNA